MSGDMPPTSTEFTLTTFNALLKGFETSAMDKQWKLWETRVCVSSEKLKARASDIILWNEVNAEMMAHFRAQGVFHEFAIGKKGRAGGHHMQCAVSWNPGVFELEGTSEPLVYRNRCLFCRMKHLPSAKTLLIVSVHLAAGENDEMEDMRVDQVHRILRAAFSYVPRVDGCILAGDLNSDPRLSHMYTEKVHTLLTTNDSIPFHNISGFAAATYNGWDELTFDYVYCNGLQRTHPPRVDEMPRKAPNRNQGSDHTPVTVRVQIV